MMDILIPQVMWPANHHYLKLAFILLLLFFTYLAPSHAQTLDK